MTVCDPQKSERCRCRLRLRLARGRHGGSGGNGISLRDIATPAPLQKVTQAGTVAGGSSGTKGQPALETHTQLLLGGAANLAGIRLVLAQPIAGFKGFCWVFLSEEV